MLWKLLVQFRIVSLFKEIGLDCFNILPFQEPFVHCMPYLAVEIFKFDYIFCVSSLDALGKLHCLKNSL